MTDSVSTNTYKHGSFSKSYWQYLLLKMYHVLTGDCTAESSGLITVTLVEATGDSLTRRNIFEILLLQVQRLSKRNPLHWKRLSAKRFHRISVLCARRKMLAFYLESN